MLPRHRVIAGMAGTPAGLHTVWLRPTRTPLTWIRACMQLVLPYRAGRESLDVQKRLEYEFYNTVEDYPLQRVSANTLSLVAAFVL